MANVLAWETKLEAESALAAVDAAVGYPRRHEAEECVRRYRRRSPRNDRLPVTQSVSVVCREPAGERWGFVVPPQYADLLEAIPVELYRAAQRVRVTGEPWRTPEEEAFMYRQDASASENTR